MSAPILATKLYSPPLRPTGVPRARLLARLNEGLHRKLTLVSAPAGFGKTTLVSEWISGCQRRSAWISLDEGDSDPARFLAYLVAALQMIAPQLGAGVAALLQSPQPPPTEALLTALINDIAMHPEPFLLVLDDYHTLDARAIDEALVFLLRHLPAHMQLVITTREDPHLPLAQLRVRGQMTELRAADLRFTPQEAATFLNQVMGLALSADEVSALEKRTEGWIAGLQMAALALQGRADTASFIQAFTGSHRFVLDYLVEEVLLHQPESVRGFLLHTAILERLCGALCDAVTGQADGSAMLEALEQSNLFVVPLDDQRAWYRYHHLFADVLQARMSKEHPEQISALHQRASKWYEKNGLLPDAIRHAFAAADFERATGLVELAIPALRRDRQDAMLLGWLKALPDEVVRARPMLSIHYAGALLSAGEVDGVERRLQDAEWWLDAMADRHEQSEVPPEMIIADREDFHRLPGSIAMYRSGIALVRGELHGAVHYAGQALHLLPADDHLGRGAAAALLGLASWASGDLEGAHRGYAEGMARMQKAGHIVDVIACAYTLADIQIAQGSLHAAMRTYGQALLLGTQQGEAILRGTADIYVGLSELHRECNDLNAATQQLLRSRELGEYNALPQNPYRWRVAMARIRHAQGDTDAALVLLQEAERVYAGDFSPNVHPVAAVKARVWIAQGRLADALAWVRERNLSVTEELTYLREYEHITLAKLLIARYRSVRADGSIRDAVALLTRLLHAAEAGERKGSIIEILVVQALACLAHDESAAALVSLQRALTLAEPEGYVRLFVDEGPPMAQLLLEATARGIMPEYTGRLLAALESEQANRVDESPRHSAPVTQALIEPLRQRELDVLRLFRSELSGPEIADQLMVALSTVRTHTKSIYSKLNVNSRRAAVLRAEELGLI